MSNGSALGSLPLPQAPSAPASPRAGAKGGIEHEIGRATADAAVLLCASMLEFHARGQMRPSTKEAGAEKIAKLVLLELDTFGEINFDGIARREGLRQLRKVLDADPDFRRQHGANAGDAALTGIIDGVLEITGKVVALERALATN